MNSVILIGRLTRDPEVRYTSGTQMAIATFNLAVDRPQRQGQEKQTDFPRVTVFGRQAETCEKYLKKGRLVCVSGRLQTGSYKNKNGDTVYTTDVVANRVEFLEWGERQGSRGDYQDYPSAGYNDGGYGNGGRQGGNGGYDNGYSRQGGQASGRPQRDSQYVNAGSGSNSDNQDMPEDFEAIEEDIPF